MSASEQTKNWGKRFLTLPCTVWALAGADTCAVAVSLLLGYCLRGLFSDSMPPSVYLSLSPALCVFPALYAALKLYPGTALHPAEELKRLSIGTSIAFLLVAATFFLAKSADSFSRAFFLASWAIALCCVPLARCYTRRKLCRCSWWKTPVVLLGNPAALAKICRGMGKNRTHGLTPVAALFPRHTAFPPYADASAAFAAAMQTGEETLPPCLSSPSEICRPTGEAPSQDHALVGGCSLLPEQLDGPEAKAFFQALAAKYGDALLALHMPSFAEKEQEGLIETAGQFFHKVMAVPGFSWLYCIPAQVIHMHGTFALTLRRNLADNRRLRMKRSIDLLFTCLLGLAALPLFFVLACLIKLDSKGPVFFRQKRVGQNGKPFHVFKFRTMQVDAERALQTYLAEHPEYAEEWRATQKLRHDPRITGMGVFLRKTSMDELPQLINVLRGEMSLVGPRPIVDDEVERYGKVFPLYARVLPGITGLWQVSGRNDVSYEERVAFDRYYIANWSVWLDIYILARTFPEVLGKRGAY